MKPTIRDVARRAGVAVSTASRALNGHGDVSPEVRARVQSVARELQFRPNHHARVLRGAATRTLGVVLHDTDAFTFNAPLMSGIYDLATPRGYGVIVCDARGSADGERQAIDMLVEKRVEGVLLNSVASAGDGLRMLLDARIPFGLLNRRLDGHDADWTTLDYRRGAALALRHLLDLGHQHVLIQLGAPDHLPTQDRLAGVRDALAAAKLPYDAGVVVYGRGPLGVYHAVRDRLTAGPPHPTAILAYNDETALPILTALREMGLRVPADIALVGQNDLPLSPYLDPPLTSVVHAIRDLARRATTRLFARIDAAPGQSLEPHQEALLPLLVVRASSASPSR